MKTQKTRKRKEERIVETIYIDSTQMLLVHQRKKLIVETVRNNNQEIINSNEISSELLSTENFHLEAVSKTVLKNLRLSGSPILVYKIEDQYYVAFINKKIQLLKSAVGSLKSHLCPNCKRFSAACDPKGCLKVRDEFLFIERYPFIRTGYQVVNAPQNVFVVQNCSNFEQADKQKPEQYSESSFLCLADYVWSGIEKQELYRKFP